MSPHSHPLPAGPQTDPGPDPDPRGATVRTDDPAPRDRPVVVYCPMEKKAWLQPDEAIGNPYVPSMLRCGEVVQR